MTDYLRPKTRTAARTRQMENGIFRNPPTYTPFGGFTSEQKFTSPSGKRQSISPMGLERGGPSAVKGKPI